MTLADARTIAAMLHRPYATIRWWAWRGWLTPQGHDPDGRIVYDSLQARAIAARNASEHDRELRG